MRRIFFLLISALLFCSFLGAYEHPSFEPLFSIEDVFHTDTAPEVYSADEVFEMGMRFSECTPGSETWQRCFEAFQKIKAEVNSKEMQALSEEERGRAILKYLYRDYLKKYSLNQTKLNVAIENGTYNCVSSAVLYLAAAKAAGLQVCGQHTTEHAFCSLYVPSDVEGKTKKIDIETTNPYGFNPGSKEEIENESQIKKYYVVPKKYYANRKQVSDGVFTGLIAGNLCSEYIQIKDYFKAVPLGAARFDAVRTEESVGSAFVRSELDILPCNYINVRPDSAAEYNSMLEWFTRFIERWGNNDFLQKNMDTCFNNLFVLCIQEKNFSQAEESYKNLSPYVSKSQLSKAHETLADIFILSKTQGQTYREQLTTIANLKISEAFTSAQQKRADLYLENAWLEILNEYMRNRDYTTGYAESQAAVQQLPQSSSIKKMNQGFYSNCIALIHNDFAKEANKGRYENALKILEKGLEEFPGDKTLTRDLNELRKIIGN